jgi:hypothetical protein
MPQDKHLFTAETQRAQRDLIFSCAAETPAHRLSYSETFAQPIANLPKTTFPKYKSTEFLAQIQKYLIEIY